ncbi:MAG: cupin domain-containing protein [Planctomycetota bacterium]
MQRVPKGWGEELWVHNDPLYCGKILRLKRGKRCSLHFHKRKTETFYLQSGRVRMELRHPDGRSEDLVMKPGDSLEIYPGLVHRFSGIEDSEIVEFSTQHFEEDSYRIEKGD